MQNDLIYDVGVNNGDDTAYYLFKGYRVLGIEADPSLIAALQLRFAGEIARNQLTLLHIALAPERKVAPFWICEDHSLWNSFDREVASRMGRKCHSVDVECWPLRDIFNQYGVPHYLKLSLHGHEHFCLADINRDAAPTYLSMELPRNLTNSDSIISDLLTLRYDSFKIIDQTTQKQLVPPSLAVKDRIKKNLSNCPPLYNAAKALAGLSKGLFNNGLPSEKNSNLISSQEGWIFPDGSSGPFGEDTDGTWQGATEIQGLWTSYLTGKTDMESPNLSIWHDLHARQSGYNDKSA